VYGSSGRARAQPLFERAIAIDPDFAIAHAQLGIFYSNEGESALSRQSTIKAYQLRHRASDAERFFIETVYDRQVTGNMDREMQTLDTRAQSYPRDNTPHGLLAGFATRSTGRYEEAVAAADGVIVQPGTYDHYEAQILTMTNQGAPVSFAMTTNAGGFFGGHRVAITPRVRLRVGETFTTELSLTRNDVDLPGGSFVTNTARSRTSYSFTPRLFLQSLVQYNDRADIWSANLRVGWLQDANTGLFIVYNDTRELGAYDVVRPTTGRSLILKFSRMFDVLR
jgi:hypothetical protein